LNREEFGRIKRRELRRERERMRGLRYERRRRWLRGSLLVVWYVLLAFAVVSAVYHQFVIGF
jgi:hypothetical protein